MKLEAQNLLKMGLIRREQPKPIQQQAQSNEGFVRQTVMAKVKMGTPGDKFEKEADATADKVVNKTSGGSENVQAMQEEEKVQQQPLASGISSVQKKDLAGEEQEPVQAKEDEESVQAKGESEQEESVQMMEEEEPVQAKEDEEPIQAKEDEEPVQTKAVATPRPKSANSIESKLKTTKGGGQKLNGKAKNEMESGFGADFSNVNIHTDGKAAEMSDQIGAQAFTHGNDVYFNQGKFDPSSTEGKHLLAHELTHTIQQSGMVQKKIQ